VFVLPSHWIQADVLTSNLTYSPGDKVDLSVQVPQSGDFYASLVVTDLSSYYRLPKGKHPPSLPAMAYLEKETKPLNGKLGEFLHSDEYLDDLFRGVKSEEDSLRVDLLLGT